MTNMKLSTLDFIKLLPSFMRQDGAVNGLASALNALVPELASDIDKLTTWDMIDSLTEPELDALAWELNILWYDSTASVYAKRDVVKNSDLVYRRLGTKWAVESVTKSYFGDGYVLEWWEYSEGVPGHFRVYSSNPSLSDEKINEYRALLEKVKRKSAVLDGVYINLTANIRLYAGTAIYESGRERYGIGASLITI